MKIRNFCLGALLFFAPGAIIFGQENENSILSKGVKYKLDDHSSVAFHFGTQAWARYMAFNPGTQSVEGDEIAHNYDVALRRTRFSMYAGFLDDKFVVYTQLGMNGQTYWSETRPQLYFHDVWSAFKMFKGKLYAGMGLHGWAGISRLSSVSYNKNIMLDHPGFSLPDLGKTDQAGRQLGMFIKGNISKINYRLSVNKPFLKDEWDSMGLFESAYYENENLSFKGYAFFSFLDEETFKSSYLGLSYLGKKKILNVGAGFDFTNDAMTSLGNQPDIIYHDKALYGVDVFLDYPFINGSVLTVYSVAYFYNYGPNYVRTYSVMNPYTSGSLAQGGGIGYFNTGTGKINYTLVGFILPENIQPFEGKLQPVAAIQLKDFEALGEPSLQFDACINYFISGYNAKVNLQYSNWKLYGGAPGYQSGANVIGARGMLVLQVQMYL